MAAPIVAIPTRSRTFPQVSLFAVAMAVVVVASIALIALAASRLAMDTSTSVEHPGYGAGYPVHGGLAGPSRVSIFDHPGYGAGYPLHGGLAGPSRLSAVDQPGYGVGYPLHGGLAGPSRADGGR